jgi:hypothetical protein
MSLTLDSPLTLVTKKNSDWEKRRARLTVCANARDTAEARELLLMLGLVKEPS